MPIAFNCEDCGASYKVNDSLAGRKARCKFCNHVMTVPTGRIASPSALSYDDLEEAEDGIPVAPVPRMPRRAPVVSADDDTSPSRRPGRTSKGRSASLGGEWVQLKFFAAFLGLIILAFLISPRIGVALAALFCLSGFVLAVWNNIRCIIIAGEEGIFHALLAWFVPLYLLGLVVRRWDDMRVPFLRAVGGVAAGLLGILIMAVVGPAALNGGFGGAGGRNVPPGAAIVKNIPGPATDDDEDAADAAEAEPAPAAPDAPAALAQNPAVVVRRPLAPAPAEDADPLGTALAQLKGPTGDQRRGLKALTTLDVPPDRVSEVVAAVLPRLNPADVFACKDALTVLSRWPSLDALPAIERCLADQSVRFDAAKALGAYTDPQAAGALARAMESDPFKSVDAGLIAMGPGAEAAVLSQLQSPEFTIRTRACEILGQIGTHETLRTMQGLPADSNGIVRMAANKAMSSIVSRHGPLPRQGGAAGKTSGKSSPRSNSP
jgi:predicted Zn finger-like uncharacterized protein